jgi:hypothetical protein
MYTVFIFSEPNKKVDSNAVDDPLILQLICMYKLRYMHMCVSSV